MSIASTQSTDRVLAVLLCHDRAREARELLIELGEAGIGLERELAGRDDHPAKVGAISGDPLGRRVHNDVGALG